MTSVSKLSFPDVVLRYFRHCDHAELSVEIPHILIHSLTVYDCVLSFSKAVLCSMAVVFDNNLWAVAASKLRDKDQVSINVNPSAKLDDLLKVVRDRKAECEKKQWRVPRSPDQKGVVLRDVFAKIGNWIENFVQIGDAVMQYDPGHAALPWAAVRVLLKVCCLLCLSL